MTPLPPGPLRRYVVAVAAGGLGATIVIATGADWAPLLEDRRVWLLAALAVFGELVPLRVPFRGGTQDVTVSTTFVFAVLLIGGVPAALVTQVAGSLLSDAIDRKPWWKSAFNAAQYALVVAATGGTFLLLGGTIGTTLEVRLFWPMVVAGVTFYVVNNVFVGGAVAMAQGDSLISFLGRDLLFQFATTFVLLSQAPLVLLVTEEAIWLLPVFAPTMAAAYRSAQVSLQRDREAMYDRLTGLPNRTSFHQAIAREAGGEQRFAVALVDVERFRDVNTTLGHDVGDLLLLEVARRLRGALDEHWLVARLGADEYGVLAPARNDDDATAVGDAIHAALASPLALDGLPFRVEVSVGVSVSPVHGRAAELLLRRAEIALAVARSRTSGTEAYRPALDRSDPRRFALLGELHDAIEGEELVLHYQPEVDVRTGGISTVEALVRWEHPARGLLAPDDFVLIAEATGLIAPLTELVLREALAQCRRFRDDELDLTVSVNVSARNLADARLPDLVEALLWEYSLPANALEIEITESAAVADVAHARTVLSRIHDLGVSIALDDFGTGQTALSYVKMLPIDKLKIDKSFVQGMASDLSDATIVRSTIELGHNLGLRVVAEGVETEGVLHTLGEFGCDLAQGFALSRPLPAERLETFVRAWRGTAPDHDPPTRRPYAAAG